MRGLRADLGTDGASGSESDTEMLQSQQADEKNARTGEVH